MKTDVKVLELMTTEIQIACNNSQKIRAVNARVFKTCVFRAASATPENCTVAGKGYVV